MKRLIISSIGFVCLFLVVIGVCAGGAGTVDVFAGFNGYNYVCSIKNGEVMKYKAEFIPNGFIYIGGCPFTSEHIPAPVIFRSREQLDGYINKIIAEFKEREKDTQFPDGYIAQFKQSVLTQYAGYDAEFFTHSNLIAGIADRGSGSLRFKFDGVKINGDTMTISLSRNSPMIQTMDFVQWTMFLSVPKTNGVLNAVIELAGS